MTTQCPAHAPRGILISGDLFFTSKVTGTAAQLGYGVQVTTDLAAVAAAILREPVACILIDLALPGFQVGEFVSRLPADRRPRLVAFGSHVATAHLQAARDAGCDAVLPRGRFSAELPNLLRTYFGEPV